jgi:cytidylate kinase
MCAFGVRINAPGAHKHLEADKSWRETLQHFIVIGVSHNAMKKLLITIDGPAGAGKTTISRNLADRIQYTYIDTGALYRGVALAAKNNGVDAHDNRGLETLCSQLKMAFRREKGGLKLICNQADVTDMIRTPEITMLASAVSANPAVRKYLLQLQRDLGREKGVVFEGRDMGTVVFPEADLKFFLNASQKARALRRFKELAPESSTTLEQVEQDLNRRDRNDSSRKIAPLKPAADAIHIDSTELSISEVVELMLSHVRAKQK